MEAIVAEENLLNHWPRRLLHIPTLTSHEWKPGPTYGNHLAPKYNALTYTWGRWRLRDGKVPEKPHISALPIRGTDWPIPRIDPAHFTASQFANVVRSTSTLEPVTALPSPHSSSSQVDFLWLNVACIDQRPSELRAAAEIGRQAAIFKGANRVFVWLTSHTKDSGQRGIDAMERFAEAEETATLEELGGLVDDLVGFLGDAWFSSLWTLQEAFLRQDAFLLSRDGELFSVALSEKSWVSPDLLDVFSWGQLLCLSCAEKGARIPEPNLYMRALRAVESRGLNALATINAMAVYGAAMQRTSILPEDRVYGIQQIFDMRLGKSALNHDLGRQFSLEELEDQLGVELMKMYPALSQFHIFTEPVPREKRWRINSCSIVPSWVSDHGHSIWESSPGGDAPCLFWVQPSMYGEGCVKFRGSITPLARLLEAREKVFREELFGDLPVLHNMFRVVTDVAEELHDSPYQSGTGYHTLVKGPQQRRLQQWLVEKFPRRRLQVLLLGESSGDVYTYFLGLLLLRYGSDTWMRLGVCQWDVSYLQISDVVSTQYEYFSGGGSGWSRVQGEFGYINSSLVKTS
ncbi:hypothetical protein EJ04DRAFT_580709 [Polyplosphaeria fusca]|uniref:Heterokaryon incompatibility domain-containing protein n=1 Tax=Polyplosphaeria fusca TaxID=682080 RepID=A0A9P4UXX1_9PLEO|nr:hypothetical protein EJ04DRAFT_580709 [Polyplosphaeria fusca]